MDKAVIERALSWLNSVYETPRDKTEWILGSTGASWSIMGEDGSLIGEEFVFGSEAESVIVTHAMIPYLINLLQTILTLPEDDSHPLTVKTFALAVLIDSYREI